MRNRENRGRRRLTERKTFYVSVTLAVAVYLGGDEILSIMARIFTSF